MDKEFRVIGKTKSCVCCKKEWSIHYFHIDRRAKDGRNSTCKRCRHFQCKKSREKSRDKYLQTLKNWRDKNPNYFKERYLRLKAEQNEHHSS